MGRIAWIIGGGSGLGAATARHLARRGWTVAVSGRRTAPLEALAAEFGAHPYPLDVSDADAVATVAARIVADLGGLDMLVYSVATMERLRTGHYDHALYQRILDVNLLGAMRAIDPVVTHMRAHGGGQIALVASVAGYFGLPRSAAYSSGKAAMIALAETMRTELARDAIRVRLISPGFVKTDFTAKNDFPMPFLMDEDDAGLRIVSGLLDSHRFEIAFPRRFVVILKLLATLPYPLFFAIMKRLLPRYP